MRRKLLIGTAAFGSLLVLAACDERDTTVSNADPRVQTAPAANNAITKDETGPTNAASTNGKAELSSDTREYIETAAMGDLFEVESSRLALSRSSLPEVKQLAQHMIDEHTKTSDDLKATLVRAGLIVELPTMLDDDHKEMLDDLRDASAREFDTTYVDQQKTAHNEGLMLHRTYAMDGDVVEIKALANAVVPKIEMHRQMVNDLEAKLRTRLSADKR